MSIGVSGCVAALESLANKWLQQYPRDSMHVDARMSHKRTDELLKLAASLTPAPAQQAPAPPPMAEGRITEAMRELNKREAARYNFLRENSFSSIDNTKGSWRVEYWENRVCTVLGGASMDAAIDSALGATPANPTPAARVDDYGRDWPEASEGPGVDLAQWPEWPTTEMHEAAREYYFQLHQTALYPLGEVNGLYRAMRSALLAQLKGRMGRERTADSVGTGARDAARLDWLERQIFQAHWGANISAPCTTWSVQSGWRHATRLMYGPNSFREAIDTAIASATGEGK